MHPKLLLASMAALLSVGGFLSSTSTAADPATEARLQALEHELKLLRQELADERATKDGAVGATDFVAGEDVPLPPLERLDEDDDIFVQPKQSAVTSLQVRGRMHYQFGYASGDGDHHDYHTHEFRRLRLGVSGKLLDDWSFELIGDILPDADSTRLDSAYIHYMGWDGLTLSFEKTRPRFGYELGTSSSNIVTVERSNLSNTLDPKKLTGAAISGEHGIFTWQVGAYNGELGVNDEETDDGNRGVPEYILNASVGVDLAEVVPLDRAALRVDYLHNADNDGLGGIALDAYEDLFSASIELGQGPFSIIGDYMYADLHENAGGGHLWGFYIMPILALTSDLEAVLRYEFIEGDRGATVRHQGRYAREVIGARGDEYWALYGGLNYYINKSVKVMLGLEYAELDGIPGSGAEEAITGYGAVRIEF